MTSRVPSVIVANDAGGVGKTLTSLLLVHGRPGCRPVGFDRTASGGPSKFARLLAADGRAAIPDFVAHPLPSTMRSREEISEAYAVVGDAAMDGAAVVDTGAKVASSLADWCRRSRAGSLLRSSQAPVWIVVPVTASAAAVRAGRDALERLGARDMFDAYRPVIVFNGLHAEFDELVGNADLAWLQGRVESGRARCVVMPRCRGGLMPFVDAERIGFAEALAISPAALAERLHISEDRAVLWLRGFAGFVVDVLGGFAEVGLVREPVAERGRLSRLDRIWAPAAARLKREIVGRIEAVPVGVGISESDIVRMISREDLSLATEAFPDLLHSIGREIAAAAGRGAKPDFETRRRAVEASFRGVDARSRRAGIHPRLGRYRRDVVLEARRRGIDPASHRVAAVSYVRDLEDLGRAGVGRALRFLTRYHAETCLLKLRLIRGRSWPPALY